MYKFSLLYRYKRLSNSVAFITRRSFLEWWYGTSAKAFTFNVIVNLAWIGNYPLEGAYNEPPTRRPKSDRQNRLCKKIDCCRDQIHGCRLINYTRSVHWDWGLSTRRPIAHPWTKFWPEKCCTEDLWLLVQLVNIRRFILINNSIISRFTPVVQLYQNRGHILEFLTSI